MELISVVFFALAFVASLWLTLYAIWEYRMERLEAFEDFVDRVAREEVHMRYLWPLLLDKIHVWGSHGGGGGSPTLTDMDEQQPQSPTVSACMRPVVSPVVRRAFCDLGAALLLHPMEFEALVCVCMDAVRGSSPLFTSTVALRQAVVDACRDYMLRPGPLQGPEPVLTKKNQDRSRQPKYATASPPSINSNLPTHTQKHTGASLWERPSVLPFGALDIKKQNT